jgi:hypothetical protein
VELCLSFRLETPVAFIIFNRPDTTKIVFAEIAKARPPILLVVSDGARADRPGEAELVRQARAIVDQVDWPCEVLTNYSEINLGCKQRVSSGLDWVFSEVEEAIILEDDCVPDPSFFQYAQELLARYRNDPRIGMINGTNLLFGQKSMAESYYFSGYGHVWGWASWRDRWQGFYDVNMTKWPEVRDGDLLRRRLGNRRMADIYRGRFEKTYLGKINTWDFQFEFANWLVDRLMIAPGVNLISNIGCDRPDATHTKSKMQEAAMPTVAMSFPLVHPPEVARDMAADQLEMWLVKPPDMVKRWRKVRAWFQSRFGG